MNRLEVEGRFPDPFTTPNDDEADDDNDATVDISTYHNYQQLNSMGVIIETGRNNEWFRLDLDRLLTLGFSLVWDERQNCVRFCDKREMRWIVDCIPYLDDIITRETLHTFTIIKIQATNLSP